MSKATEKQLSTLHGKVAETMVSALDQADNAALLLDKYHGDREEELPADVRLFLQSCREIHPSLLTVATKFLKDNNISCDAASDEELTDLEQRLAKKRADSKARVTDVSFH